jgi:hypothetical protein
MATRIPDDSVLVRNARLAVEMELKKKRALKQPIARFDPKSGRIYMENGDGTITECGVVTRQGRYGKQKD